MTFVFKPNSDPALHDARGVVPKVLESSYFRRGHQVAIPSSSCLPHRAGGGGEGGAYGIALLAFSMNILALLADSSSAWLLSDD